MLNSNFIFYHIPKCGGTSVRLCLYDLFKQVADDNKIYLPQQHPELVNRQCSYAGKNLTRLQDIDETFDYTLYKYYLCHVTRHVCKHLNIDNPVTMTVFRHPVDRLISHYTHFHQEECNEPPLNQLRKKQLIELCDRYKDVMTRYIVDTPGEYTDQQVFESVNKIDYIAVLEKLNIKSLIAGIAARFNIQYNVQTMVDDKRRNVRNSGNQVLPIIKELLTEYLNDSIDMKLYNYVSNMSKFNYYQQLVPNR